MVGWLLTICGHFTNGFAIAIEISPLSIRCWWTEDWLKGAETCWRMYKFVDQVTIGKIIAYAYMVEDKVEH